MTKANEANKEGYKEKIAELQKELAEMTEAKESYGRMADGVVKALEEEEYWAKKDNNS